MEIPRPFIPSRHAWFNDNCSGGWRQSRLIWWEASEAGSHRLVREWSKDSHKVSEGWEEKPWFNHRPLTKPPRRLDCNTYWQLLVLFKRMIFFQTHFLSLCYLYPHVNFTLPSRVFAKQAVNASFLIKQSVRVPIFTYSPSSSSQLWK